jgi:hypothetical protein
LYIAALAIISLRWQGYAARLWTEVHLNFLFLTLLVLNIYRNIWPLATYNREPEDASEGWRLWATIAVLTAIGLIIPLAMPTQYVPVDPEVRIDTFRTLHSGSLCYY